MSETLRGCDVLPNDLVSGTEAREILGVGRSVFQNIAKRERLEKFTKPTNARSVYYRRADIEALLMARPADRPETAK